MAIVRARFLKATIVLIAVAPLLAGDCRDSQNFGIDTYNGPFEIFLSPDAGTTTRLVTLTVNATEPILGPVGGTLTVSYWNKDRAADQDPDPAMVRVVVIGFPFADGGNGFGDPGEPDDAGVRLHAIWEHDLSGPGQRLGGGDVDIMHACAGDVTCVRKLRISWTVLHWGSFQGGITADVMTALAVELSDPGQRKTTRLSLVVELEDAGITTSPDGGN